MSKFTSAGGKVLSANCGLKCSKEINQSPLTVSVKIPLKGHCQGLEQKGIFKSALFLMRISPLES